ncbi:thiosulfate oxidation carrier complex protein SoxZ [Ferribacterium limneticum]|uniref:thiosulfate oxidation carrier complex protein SoxZ n=1 Tax=Ferribacterium limneticum TaxID=76259 RepID=UPI001CFC3CAB|nr:thiosulfate oxidation carrier complex protein SoxZ [Ferribacterium limneticum]UCV29529.1 thiosulfate oxidation carrier complex protein SoxZ [Ferribacterium limneticum]UCV33448.1 thiosulfate oxidation carrier complex protein SoxZ [Ferribacterium limneticum]
MGNPMKIRAANKDGVTEVKVLVSHEMETGQRKDAAGAIVPAWFITELVAKHGDKLVLSSEFGPSVSKNPYLAFKFKGGAKGEKVTVSWKDNKGDTRSDEAVIN